MFLASGLSLFVKMIGFLGRRRLRFGVVVVDVVRCIGIVRRFVDYSILCGCRRRRVGDGALARTIRRGGLAAALSWLPMMLAPNANVNATLILLWIQSEKVGKAFEESLVFYLYGCITVVPDRLYKFDERYGLVTRQSTVQPVQLNGFIHSHGLDCTSWQVYFHHLGKLLLEIRPSTCDCCPALGWPIWERLSVGGFWPCLASHMYWL